MTDFWDNLTKSQQGRIGMGAGAGGIASGLASIFGGNGQNPADAGMKFLNQIPGEAHRELDPWKDYGMSLTQHPGERLNEIGGNFHESPGFQFALQQALQGAGHAAAAGGMAGSPEHEFQNQAIGTQLGNQDYYNYLQNALGLHNTGYSQGQTAATNTVDQIIQALAAKSGLSYKGQAAQNESFGGGLGNLFGGIGTLAAFF